MVNPLHGRRSQSAATEDHHDAVAALYERSRLSHYQLSSVVDLAGATSVLRDWEESIVTSSRVK